MTRGQPWFEDFEAWALRTGAPRKRKSQPTRPMKPSTVEDALQKIKSLLRNTNPPYLKATAISRRREDMGEKVKAWRNGDQLIYNVSRDINLLTLDELLTGLKELFPGGITEDVAQTYRHYQQACVLLIRYLIYERKDHGRPIMAPEDLERFRELAPSVQVRMTLLHIIEPEIIDEFLEWLKPLDHELWAACFVQRNLGLRYVGMRGARVDLTGGPGPQDGKVKVSTLKTFEIVNGERILKVRPHVNIWEKHLPREFDLWDDMYKFIIEQQKYVQEKFPSSEWLFPNREGNQWARKSGFFNRTLRVAYVRWFRQTFNLEPDAEDIKALRAHGFRHACGTYLVKLKVNLPTVKNILGHQDYSTLERYVAHVRTSTAQEINEALDMARLKRESNGQKP